MFGKPILVKDGVYQIRAIGSRVTVVVSGGSALLVDAGLRGSLGAIRRGLRTLGLSTRDVEVIAITHAHPDHVGGLAELAEATQAVIAAHHREADVIAGIAPAPSPFARQDIGALAQPAVLRLMPPPVGVDVRLEDGDAIPFEEPAFAVHLPGHTEGSIAVHLPRKRVVIVGDALQYRFGRRLTPPFGPVTPRPKKALRSIAKLLALDFDVICFAHFPPLRDNAHDALREMIERQERR